MQIQKIIETLHEKKIYTLRVLPNGNPDICFFKDASQANNNDDLERTIYFMDGIPPAVPIKHVLATSAAMPNIPNSVENVLFGYYTFERSKEAIKEMLQ